MLLGRPQLLLRVAMVPSWLLKLPQHLLQWQLLQHLRLHQHQHQLQLLRPK